MTIPQPTPPTGPYDPIFGLQEKVASLLTPIFQDDRTDELFAYQIACRSLQTYEPETRADFLNIGRMIAFGLASMVFVKEAFKPEVELADKKRVAVFANALNRSADQAERSMMERRRYRRAYPTFPVPVQAAPEPDDIQPETQAAETVTPSATAQPTPPKPAVNRAPPPIKPSSTYDTGPNPTNLPPDRPDPLTTAAMLHAVTPGTPPPHPHSRSSGH